MTEVARAAEEKAGAPLHRRLIVQSKAEVAMALRRGESLLVTLGIPLILLVFFAEVHAFTVAHEKPIDFLAPGILALAVMSTAMVSLGIATGFERGYKYLKRLGSTPLGRPALITAKVAGVLVLEIIQVALILAVAAGLGWNGGGNAGEVIAVMILGTIAFSGIGLLLAGSLKAEVNLAVTNGLYIVLLLVGDMIVPLSRYPGWLAAIAKALPAAALAEGLSHSLGHSGGVPGSSWAVLIIWAVAAPAAAALAWRWE